MAIVMRFDAAVALALATPFPLPSRIQIVSDPSAARGSVSDVRPATVVSLPADFFGLSPRKRCRVSGQSLRRSMVSGGSGAALALGAGADAAAELALEGAEEGVAGGGGFMGSVPPGPGPLFGTGPFEASPVPEGALPSAAGLADADAEPAAAALASFFDWKRAQPLKKKKKTGNTARNRRMEGTTDIPKAKTLEALPSST
jgi:hypothetical protein